MEILQKQGCTMYISYVQASAMVRAVIYKFGF